MKRSGPLRRYTRLKQGDKPLKRSPMPRPTKAMNKIGPNKKREKRDTDKPRRALREEAGECMSCERRKAVHTHEIAAGGSRCKAVYLPRLQAALCDTCHREWHDAAMWPPHAQIAIVTLWHLQKACEEYCRVKGKAPTACTPAEVLEVMRNYV